MIRNRPYYHRLYGLIGSLLGLILAPGVSSGIEVIDYQRGIHADFELHVVYCDTLPEFRLEYDRVRSECRLEIIGAEISGKAEQQVARYCRAITVNSIQPDNDACSILYDLTGTTFLRAYIVSGPPALIIDFSEASDMPGRFPFELDKNGYLQQSALAENSGKLELALEYIDWIEKAGPADPVVVHRAGIIQHKLSRWETALETFGKSLNQPDLVADARAHRAMIYLTIGDTTSSGVEWSSYFHKTSPELPDEKAISQPKIIKTDQVSSRKKSPLPFSILHAGDGNSIYLGGAIFVIGILVLIRLLTGNRTYSQVPFHYYNSNVKNNFSSESSRKPTGFSPYSRLGRSEPSRTAIRDTRLQTIIPQVSTMVVDSYRTESSVQPPEANSPKIERKAGRGVPVDLIIEKSKGGADELEIARSVGISRDEVAMVLNLSRLAGRN